MILLIIQPAAEETSGISGPSRARRSPPAEGLTRPCCTNLRLYNESLYRLCSLIVNDELLTCESALAHWWWCHLCLMQHRQAGAAIDTIHLSISATKERADVCVYCAVKPQRQFDTNQLERSSSGLLTWTTDASAETRPSA
jgi:hypothetical protein